MKLTREDKLKVLLTEIEELIQFILECEEHFSEKIQQVHPKYVESAKNLVHYQALKTKKLNNLQKRLGNFGLSKLSESEAHIMASLRTTRAIILSMLNEKITFPKHSLSFKKSRRLQNKNTKTLLGYRSKGRRTRIMVTLPTEAADNYQLVHNLIQNGMNCARINCGHDDKTEWQKMVDNVKMASQHLQKKCKISMDLGGPKIRTGKIAKDAKVIKVQRSTNILGKEIKSIQIFFGEQTNDSELPSIPLQNYNPDFIKENDELTFTDVYFKIRKIKVKKMDKTGFIGEITKTTFFETGFPIKIDNSHQFFIGELDEKRKPIFLQENDILLIKKEQVEGRRATISIENEVENPAYISCTAPQIFAMVKVGEPILFDDGEIEGIIENLTSEELKIRITRVPLKGGKLKADKGINLPKSDLHLPSLSEKDKENLPFVLQNSDVIDMSFVNRSQDVSELLSILETENIERQIGIILKIETVSGFENLTEIILEAMKIYPIGVMIARGDLAVEVGWDKIGRIQEEILSICKSAHITSVWATQVLENLAKKGIPSRAEITDTIMAQRADCVMLNKGPYIIRAINLLNTILKNMKIKATALKPMQD